MEEKEEGTRISFTKEKVVILENFPLHKKHILRALSWVDFVPIGEFDSDDQLAIDSLIKLINYLTRKA